MAETAYIGDGVYATWDGWSVWLDCRGQPSLTTGPHGYPGIALEPSVLQELVKFVERMKKD